jgi:hypothetical protein
VSATVTVRCRSLVLGLVRAVQVTVWAPRAKVAPDAGEQELSVTPTRSRAVGSVYVTLRRRGRRLDRDVGGQARQHGSGCRARSR